MVLVFEVQATVRPQKHSLRVENSKFPLGEHGLADHSPPLQKFIIQQFAVLFISVPNNTVTITGVLINKKKLSLCCML